MSLWIKSITKLIYSINILPLRQAVLIFSLHFCLSHFQFAFLWTLCYINFESCCPNKQDYFSNPSQRLFDHGHQDLKLTQISCPSPLSTWWASEATWGPLFPFPDSFKQQPSLHPLESLEFIARSSRTTMHTVGNLRLLIWSKVGDG